MLRILLDENIPIGLKSLLTWFEVRTAAEMGWAGITNGRLLDAAEGAGFQVMVTADRNIRTQQRLAGRKITLVVINANHWNSMRADAAAVVAACDGAGRGRIRSLPWPDPCGADGPLPRLYRHDRVVFRF
jgi:hypothetical protein